MDTETNSVAVGLNAKALGWPDAATHDLSELFAYALIRAARKARGLPYLPLRPADDGIVESPWEKKDLGTAAECAAVARTLLMDGVREMRDAHGIEGVQPISIRALIKRLLGLRTKYLVQPLYGSQREASLAYGRDPEGQAVAALAVFLLQAIETAHSALATDIEMISLLIIDRAAAAGLKCGKQIVSMSLSLACSQNLLPSAT